MQRGDIFRVLLNCQRRAGGVLALAQQYQLYDIVDTVVIARSAIDLSIDQDEGCAGQSDRLTIVPGGAAGEDPVGPAVRALREQSDSLEDFVNTISWMTSFEQLQEAVK